MPRDAGTTQQVLTQCARTVMFVRVELTTLTSPLPPREMLTSPPLLAWMPHAAQARVGAHQRYPAVRQCAVSTAHRGGTTGRVLRVLAAHAVRHCTGACGALQRDGSHGARLLRGYSAVHMDHYVREGRADDADVAGAAIETHEPAATGLHATRRASLRRRPPTVPGGTPVRCEYCTQRRYHR
jgi:hypothetical protein